MRVLLCLVALAAAAPEFPDSYTAVMVMRMPYFGLDMPIKTVTTPQRQVVEYFNGLQLDIHDKATGDYKYAFTTVKNGESKRRCLHNEAPHLKASSSDDASGVSFVPDLSTYKLAGKELVGGIMCDKYTYDEKHGTYGNMDDHIAFYYDPIMEKPVRWHQHSRNKVFESHTDEYIFDYVSFESRADQSALALPSICKEEAVKADITLKARGLMQPFHYLRVADPAATFDAFLAKHGKTYSTAEYKQRLEIYSKNINLVKELNNKHAGKASFKGNEFLDMTVEEVVKYRGGRKHRSRADRPEEHKKYVSSHKLTGQARPKDFDWRTARPGVVGRVKDQAVCGSCWTFSLISSLESIQAVETGNFIEMPEQFVLDCGWTDTSAACDGGMSDDGALNIVHKFGGIVPSAKAYGPYLTVDGYCKDTHVMELGTKIRGWVDVAERDDDAVMDALVNVGVLSIGITVPAEMIFYDRGILDVKSCEDHSEDLIDHAVNLVGYGTENGVDYWTVRNSWSEYWGDNGYIRVRRGDRDCAVSQQVGYPTLETHNEILV